MKLYGNAASPFARKCRVIAHELGIKLLERAGAQVIGCSFVIDLPELGGADKLRAIGKPVTALVAFEGH